MSYFALGGHNKRRGIPKPAPALPAGGPGIHEGEIAALSPNIHLMFSETSGTSLADSSGNSRTGTLNGSGATLAVTALAGQVGATNKAIDLGGAAWISIPHASADVALTVPTAAQWAATRSVTDPDAATNGFRFIADTTVSIRFKPQTMPTGSNKAVIWAKAHTSAPQSADGTDYAESPPITASRGDTRPGGSVSAYFDANGALFVDMRSFRGRPCTIRTPDGAISNNTTYHLAVRLSYSGVTAWLDGAQFENGVPNLMHVYGLSANIRGAVFLNNYNWTIGRAAWGGQSDIIVDEFCVFHRAPSETISQSDVNTLAQVGDTPTALGHYIWDRDTVSVAATAANTAITNMSAAGGGTVIITSSGTTTDIVPKSNVRIKGTSTAIVVRTIRTPDGTYTNLTNPSTNFLTGAKSIAITSHNRSVGDVIRIMATAGNPSPRRLDRHWNTTTESNDPNVVDGEPFLIESINSNTLTFEGVGSSYDFAAANRQGISAFTPVRNFAIETITVRYTGATPGSSFNADGPLRLRNVANVRVWNVIVDNGGTDSRALQVDRNCMNVQISDSTVSGTTGVNNALFVWLNGCKDCVAYNNELINGSHAYDVGANANFGPILRGEFHNSAKGPTGADGRDVAGSKAAFGIHGTAADCIYWNLSSDWGGPAITGWKHCARWIIGGSASVASSAQMSIPDGGGDCALRNLHAIRPEGWFTSDGLCGADRNYFEDITRSANPPAGTSHDLNYGTGADANRYLNGTVTDPSGSWTAI